ncbi:hypothetical protein [Nonlabens marinus]|uniref:Uncharacterized protein n=1 Tax=Nonlabens marinus S1-08 TaxID=1454201 RepID=W8VUU7_9FLAO|nr:hypothetical protein [Nonlabens marinus]BAO54908.1 hypothetical protein NMS_0899 [Nonlabens marinus S1-08]
MADYQTTKQNEQAKDLMHSFAERTGLEKEDGQGNRRYLWTDSFAVLNFLALKKLQNDKVFEDYAIKAIDKVHNHLGKFAPYDTRKGWISGLPDETAQQHPTVKGLRIGKKLPERKEDDPIDQRLEWERDGQYFHYHTRWIIALLKSGRYFDKEKFIDQATELSLAGSRFIKEDQGSLNMYWKMSVDMSRPLIPRMGAHDPLEGLLCALQARELSFSYDAEFDGYINKLKRLCASSDWGTDDALGIGGLLLNVVRAAELQEKIELPDSIKPERLLRDAQQGLAAFRRLYKANESANYRLAFRECGLSLGLRCLEGNLEFLKDHNLKPSIPDKSYVLAEEIESFWLREENKKAATYTDHLDINEVSIAASLLAIDQPKIYTRL